MKCMKEFSFFCIWILLTLTVDAQQMMTLPPFPKHPQQNDWYFNDIQHKVWIYREDDWQQLPIQNCRKVVCCNDHLILKDGFTYSLADLSGKILLTGSPMITCLYKFVRVGGKGHLDYLLTNRGDTLTAFVNNCKIYEDTVKGKHVFCLPAYSPGLEAFSCAQLRNWGMMDETGKWWIEPKFDKPFHFDHCKSEVWYKGMPSRIDENGDFLEE